ncbi:hypothetical protein ZIOFF_029664 [Zingiber officinale]|uniref:Exostosin GT47 domain-containing protein n=1 Tax=Zingiber officinale TaxID=94328 RepID=A0A8J5GX14_ZINOF|nr:hypothetical protein ZIOFF_029664 [Zingiber officinale]
MLAVDLDKAVLRRLRCGGVGASRKSLLLVAVGISVAALFLSLFPSSTSRVSDLFSAADSHNELFLSSSAPPPPLVTLPASTTQGEEHLIFLSPSGSPGPAAAPHRFPPSPSPIGDFDALAIYLDEFDLKEPPLEDALVLAPSPTPVVNFAAAEANSSNTDGKTKSFAPEPPRRPAIKTPAFSPKVEASFSNTDRQLVYAKKEIANAPPVFNDPDLHAPLFLNVSMFKRSYELMEKILKVYIYGDGPRPLFHTPELGGIYASEGWFMKLMEGSKKFVTKDPEKAHLFYMPFSSRQLRANLYVPDSHSNKPLSIFLRNYINMISAKYPFWNRTRGADHFFAGCHDWATYITRLHGELRDNAIKVVCNADVSEGIFIRGKDVSLPETYIRNPKRPQRGIGGRPSSKRSILAFFAGHMHGRVRPILIGFWKGRDPDMRIYEVLPEEVAAKMSYAQHMKSSKFCICPMGYEVNSPRIVESIYFECVPVIIVDHFVLPFEEVLDWRAFSVVVAEKDIQNLKDILLGIGAEQYRIMQMNVKKLQKHFLWNARPKEYDLFHMTLHSVWYNRLNQIDL